jgi:hypothetical protein
MGGYKGNKSKEETNAKEERLQSVQNDPFSATSLDYLLMHAHVSRISLNFRPDVHDLYEQHAKTIHHNDSSSSNATKVAVLRIAMHLRHGNACHHETTGYEQNASILDSPAQFAAKRLCYDTSVYLPAL